MHGKRLSVSFANNKYNLRMLLNKISLQIPLIKVLPKHGFISKLSVAHMTV